MRLNRKTGKSTPSTPSSFAPLTPLAITTSKVLLVPYEPHHVLKYHTWMQDPALREATASEALTLEKEYSNQVSWRKATDKLTFILCKPIDRSFDGEDVVFVRSNGHYDSIEEIIGDVNFFLHAYEGDGEEEAEGDVVEDGVLKKKGLLTGEVDIMVADAEWRRRGIGRAAVRALLVYVTVNLGFILQEYVGTRQDASASLKNLIVKIKQGNAGSIALFRGLGFKQEGEVNYFGEVKLVLELAELQAQSWWAAAMADYGEMPYGSMVEELRYNRG